MAHLLPLDMTAPGATLEQGYVKVYHDWTTQATAIHAGLVALASPVPYLPEIVMPGMETQGSMVEP